MTFILCGISRVEIHYHVYTHIRRYLLVHECKTRGRQLHLAKRFSPKRQVKLSTTCLMLKNQQIPLCMILEDCLYDTILPSLDRWSYFRGCHVQLFIHPFWISVLCTYISQLHIYTVCVHIASPLALLIVNPQVLYCNHDVYIQNSCRCYRRCC